MTINPMTRTVVAIAIPALLFMQLPVQAECTNCTPDTHIISISKPAEETNKLIKLNAGTGYIVSTTLQETPFITITSQQFLEELGKVYLEKCRAKKLVNGHS